MVIILDFLHIGGTIFEAKYSTQKCRTIGCASFDYEIGSRFESQLSAILYHAHFSIT